MCIDLTQRDCSLFTCLCVNFNHEAYFTAFRGCAVTDLPLFWSVDI